MGCNGRVVRGSGGGTMVQGTMVHRGGSSVMRAPTDSMHGSSGECSNATIMQHFLNLLVCVCHQTAWMHGCCLQQTVAQITNPSLPSLSYIALGGKLIRVQREKGELVRCKGYSFLIFYQYKYSAL